MRLPLFSGLLAATTIACLTAGVAPATPIVGPGENIALGKTYSLAPRPDYRLCTDPDDDKQLTDGIYTTGYFWTQKSTVGWQSGKPVIITIDLGKVEPICGASFNTAAGAAVVTWPAGISVLVSDDGRTFHEACELTDLSAQHGLPPATGYAVHRFWTDALRAHGRQVMFVVAGGSYTFVDEIEVYRGDPAQLSVPLAGETVTNAAAFVSARQVGTSVMQPPSLARDRLAPRWRGGCAPTRKRRGGS